MSSHGRRSAARLVLKLDGSICFASSTFCFFFLRRRFCSHSGCRFFFFLLKEVCLLLRMFQADESAVM